MEIHAHLYELAGEDVQVAPYLGRTGVGDSHGPAVTVRAIVDDQVRLVRNKNGDEVTASTTLYCPLSTNAPVDSAVTVRGRRTVVIASGRRDGRAMAGPSHVELMCE